MATSGLSPVCSFLFVMISLSLPADANIGAFCGTAKNVASVIFKNLLTGLMFSVNKNNALIYRVGNGVFVCGKRCFLCFGAARAFYGFLCAAAWVGEVFAQDGCLLIRLCDSKKQEWSACLGGERE